MLMSACAALLIPLSAAAKPPAPVGCQLIVPDSAQQGAEFQVTVVRDPEFPGQWFSPTVTVELFVPTGSTTPLVPQVYSQSVTQTFLGLGGANRAGVVFYVPTQTSLGWGVSGEVHVVATVSEPTSNRKTRDAVCDGVITFQ
jgi:hypothetical protein